MVYLPALSIKISQMWVHNSYMDPSWDNIFKHPTSGDQDRTHQLHSRSFKQDHLCFVPTYCQLVIGGIKRQIPRFFSQHLQVFHP